MITLPVLSQEKHKAYCRSGDEPVNGRCKIIFNDLMTNQEAGIDQSYQGENTYPGE
ncbi:MAG: hypothetical protein U5L09_03190 [Bacteroidales bacterium]|nr:hypothetical protein [Bacteroidales bacterium]